MRFVRWVAVLALFAVGIGAVYASSVGLGGTEAAASRFLTQAAEVTDVKRTSAATGTVTSAASYGLRFGADPYLVDAGSTGSGTASSWVVKEVFVAVGDRVPAGQRLATADTTDLQSQLALAQASLERARIRLSQAEDALAEAPSKLREQIVAARESVDSARLSLRNAEDLRDDAGAGAPTRQARIGAIAARGQLREAKRDLADLQAQREKADFPDETVALSEAQAQVADLEAQVADLAGQLERASLVAPVDGVVAALNVEPGLAAPDLDAVIVDSATLQVVADVVESDIPALAVGQTASIGIDALGRQVMGTVSSIAPTTGGGTSSVVTFPVTVSLDGADEAIKPGMSADVEIEIASAAQVLAVPSVALRGSGDVYMVNVATVDGGVEPRQVSVGLVTDSLAEIRSGLQAGESVVVGVASDRSVAAGSSSGLLGGSGFPPSGFGGLRGGRTGDQ